MTDKPPQLPVVEILYINRYGCTCGATFEVPNPKLMYRYQSKRGWTKNGVRTRTVTTTKGRGYVGLPREIKLSPIITLTACPSCFTPRHQAQHTLDFDPAEIENGVTPTPLSEF